MSPFSTHAVLVLIGKDGAAQRIDGPFSLDQPHTWRGTLPESAALPGQPGRLEVLAWTGPDARLPADADPGLLPALEALRARPDVRRIHLDFIWQRPPLEDFMPGTPARQCWQVYDARRHDDEAIALCRAAWSEGRLDPVPRSRLGNRLGLMYRLRGDFEDAARVLGIVARDAGAAGAVSRARTALYNRADVLLNAGELRRADETLEQALELTRAAGDLAGQAALRRKSGQVLQRLGDYPRADAQLRAAVQLADRLGLDRVAAHTHYDLAVLHVQLGDMARALEELDAAAPHFLGLEAGDGASKPGNWEDLGKFFGTRGWVRAAALRHDLRPDSAAAIDAECYEKAVRYLDRLSPGSIEVVKHRLLAVDLYVEAGDVAGAQARLDQAVPDPRVQLGNPAFRRTRGELRLARKDWRGALEDFQALERLEAPDPDLAWTALFGQARALAGLGRRAEASARLEAAMMRVETQARTVVPGLDRGWYIGDREDLYRFSEQLELEAGDVAGAFAAAERSRVLAGQRRATRARVDWLLAHDPEGLRGRQAQLEALYESLRPVEAEVTLAPNERKRRSRERETLRQSIRTAEAALADWIERAAPSPTAARPDLDSLRAALASDEAVIGFSATPRQLVAYRIDATGIRARPLDLEPGALRQRVEAARAALLEGRQDGLDRLAHILLDAAHPLPTRRLIVVPYGPLFRLPFQALPVDGAPLVERLEVVYAPSAALLAGRRSASRPGASTTSDAGGPTLASGPAEVVGDPTRNSGGPALVVGDPTLDLAATRDEARAVAGFFPGATLLLGEAAARNRVLDALSRAALFHFAGHGVMAGDSPYGPHLLLAGRERLTASDLWMRPLRARLVALSGCDTGEGILMGGGDFQGLTSGFLGAGAGAVLATAWRLEQRDALPLMQAFYRKWRIDGDPPARALRRSVQEARNGTFGAAYAHPRVWAAMALWGDGDARVDP